MPRIQPSFMIIGERKCGTSSLYRYLIEHPEVLPAKVKEPAFFSKPIGYIRRNFQDYLSFFPSTKDQKITLSWPELSKDGTLIDEDIDYLIDSSKSYITGEASANTFSTVHPSKVHEFFPDMKFIVMVREPIARAISQHAMYRRYKKEGRKGSWLVGSPKRDLKIEKYAHQLGLERGPFLAPGKYINNFRKWFQWFNQSQFLIINMHEMESQGQQVMNTLCDFLEIQHYDFSYILEKRFNSAGGMEASNDIRRLLKGFFDQSNMELERLIKKELNW